MNASVVGRSGIDSWVLLVDVLVLVVGLVDEYPASAEDETASGDETAASLATQSPRTAPDE